MTEQTGRTWVAAGVDGSMEATEAARYAAHAAHVRGLSLLLVHAYQPPPRSGTLTKEGIDAARRAADQLVREVASQVRVATDQQVDTLVELTTPELLLRRVADRSALVAVGQHVFHLGDQLLTGPVASAVAATARCPVVVVPRGWSRTHGRDRSIAIALDGETAAEAALAFAFGEAELYGLPLVAVHAMAPAAAGGRPRRRTSVSCWPASASIIPTSRSPSRCPAPTRLRPSCGPRTRSG